MKNRGFTLVELLVVIAIIGILSSIVFVNLSTAKGKARDATRKSDLKSLALSLQQYYSDNNAYPVSPWYSSEAGDVIPNGPNNNGQYIPGLAPTYLQSLPHDPLGGDSTLCAGRKRAYAYVSDGASYKLLAMCSPEGTFSATDIFYDPVRPTTAWMVCSDNTSCTTW